jgi:Zinc carboxypeptidase
MTMQERAARMGVAIAAACAIGMVAAAAVRHGPASAHAQAAPALAAPSPEALGRDWDAHHVSPPLAPLVTHADVTTRVAASVAGTPDLFSTETIGDSVEGRSLHHVWFGRGPTHVLLWSQMHGDEPTATSALFDLLDWIRRERRSPVGQRLLDALTVHLVPMLNPDGAQRFRRRNAQGLDINRDALLLQTPEGRALKALRDRLEPSLGFNLHNQNWSTSVGHPARPASMSLLAVAHDEARSDNPGRILAKKTGAIVRDAVEAFVPGQVGRYSDEFEVRAFGDNIARWGTPVLLIETGPIGGDAPEAALVRLNFVALVTALDALASGRATEADPRRYESLPENGSRLLHTLVRNATILAGTGVAPFTGDIGIGASRLVREVQGARTLSWAARIDDLGDLRVYGALHTIDADGMAAAPMLVSDAVEGDQITLPDWKTWKGPTLSVGEPGALLLLQALDGTEGRYVVRKIVRP